MNRALLRILVLLGIVFAFLSAISLLLLVKFQSFSEKRMLFNPLTFGSLGILVSAIIKFDKSEYAKKWSDRIIYLNLLGVVVSFVLYFVHLVCIVSSFNF